MLEQAPDRVVAGRYRLSRPLAQGAMGSVWVAKHMQLGVDIAIKFMAPQYAASPDLRARFEREARAAAMLKSLNAVQIYDYGVEDGSPYIVMELLEGEDLAARLARERRLSIRATFDILAQVGKALRRAHELGLVHRDLKPANIFLARVAGEGIVKVVDFGIAKSMEPMDGAQATRSGTLLGSPSYMSPEQVRSSHSVDHRTDLWSLGVIAFQCVTGQLLFPGNELGEVLVDVVTKPIPLASQVAPDLGTALDGFFSRALARDPGQRFQSADELVAAFAALPGARAVEAPEASQKAPEGTVLVPDVGAARASGPETTIGAGTEIAPPRDAQPGIGTLSPAAQTRPDEKLPGRGRSTGLLIGVGVGVAALGLGLFALTRAPSPPPDAPPADAPSVSSDPAPAAPPPASPAPEVEPPAPAPSIAPTATPSSSAPSPSTSRPAVSPGRPPPAPVRKRDDLLNHM
ncbi:serine/threonine-protein kinase [Polyangium aurulentum]|uniref:serine/threonine-protein kinase n=1 Tax=Polyangium aurulentum TaxID=2567896 RepID=UPI0010AE5D5A|nr:serine/threonine-protein kinase [Polyangium aurulentum]UQA57782.1 serine/threonine protein kinase [Polyangium aurulentum]